MEEVPHKKYLNEFFQGHTEGSVSRGELYNDDPTTGDARFCGTTASMCGLETATTPEEEAPAIRQDLMLHAMMLFQSGIPMLYSGDEIGLPERLHLQAGPGQGRRQPLCPPGQAALGPVWHSAATAPPPQGRSLRVCISWRHCAMPHPAL